VKKAAATLLLFIICRIFPELLEVGCGFLELSQRCPLKLIGAACLQAGLYQCTSCSKASLCTINDIANADVRAQLLKRWPFDVSNQGSPFYLHQEGYVLASLLVFLLVDYWETYG